MNKAPYELTAILREWERCTLTRIDANEDLIERTAVVVGHRPWLLQKLLFVIHANGMLEATNAMRVPINTIADQALATIAFETKQKPDPKPIWLPVYKPPKHDKFVLVCWGTSQRRDKLTEHTGCARFNQTTNQWEWFYQPDKNSPTYQPVDTTSEFIYEWSDQ